MQNTRSRLRSALAAAALALSAAPGATVDAAPQLRTLTAVIENDSAVNSDRNYTNGFRLAWVHDNVHTDGPTGWLATRLLRADADSEVWRGLAVGQSMFTPRDIELDVPPADQHPYGAWLHGEYAVMVRRAGVLDRLSIQIGMAGDEAGGQTLQNEIHRILGVPRARGWDYAIDNEPGIVVRAARQYPALFTVRTGPLEVDLTPSIAVSVGNIFTDAAAGAMLRFGPSLADDFGPMRVRPAAVGAGDFAYSSSINWYAFAGFEARYVAHNFFLEGSLFRDDPRTVTAEPLLYDLHGGFAIQYRRMQLSFALVRRSEQFEQQDYQQSFASIALGVVF